MAEANSKTQFSTFHLQVLSLLNFCKGLAIACIFLFHYQKTWFGWQGVHIFIVLSGFGLTYSCLHKNENILWKHWYIRRAERILPTYWLVSIVGFLFLIYINLRSEDLFIDTIKSLSRLFLDLSLLRNFFHYTIFNYPNDQLWFVPLVCSFYIIFPLFYTLIINSRKVSSYLLILLGAIATEFIYGAISVYTLDGLPVGFEVKLFDLPFLPLEPLNKISDLHLFPFQLEAPFGLFPARIAEFIVGMIGAVLLFDNEEKFKKIFSISMVVVSVIIWLTGYYLVYIGLWGWAFANFFIALGLTLCTVNIACFFQQTFPSIFINISQLGRSSYYVFLTHSIVIYISEFKIFMNIEKNLIDTNLSGFLLFKLVLFAAILVVTATLSWLLMQFDNSKLPKIIINKTIGQVFK